MHNHTHSNPCPLCCAPPAPPPPLQALATDLLATVRKTESSLKRLKKTSAAEGEGGAAMSDSDKIGLQLFLDVQEFGVQVRLGVRFFFAPLFCCLVP